MKVYLHILLIFTLATEFMAKANLYFTNANVSIAIEFTEESCQVFTDSKEITDLLEKDPQKFNMISDEELAEIQAPCMLSPRFGLFGNEKYGFIYPGTLWCGRGTKARSYSELGVHSKEDSCCRDHDNCPSSITAGQCKAGACNTSSFTRSHCECDRKFQECLRNSGTETGNTIGAIFFNIAKIYCFQEVPRCPAKSRVIVDNANKTLTCPFEFLESQKYVFSEPMFTWRNSRAFLINLILRKLRK